MGVMNMKKLALILTLLFVVSCSPKSSTKKAVYFFQKQAQLSSEDLQAHPEVIVVQTFDEFKKYANQKVALWTDKSANQKGLSVVLERLQMKTVTMNFQQG